MEVIHNLQDLLQKLPSCCYSTLQHLISHLQKWADSWAALRLGGTRPPLYIVRNFLEYFHALVCCFSSQGIREWWKQDVTKQLGHCVRAHVVAPPCVHRHVIDGSAGDQLPGCSRWVPHYTPWQDFWSSANFLCTSSTSPSSTSSRHPSPSFLSPRGGSELRTWKLFQRVPPLSGSKYRSTQKYSLCPEPSGTWMTWSQFWD